MHTCLHTQVIDIVVEFSEPKAGQIAFLSLSSSSKEKQERKMLMWSAPDLEITNTSHGLKT